jgi:hypothetical protein
VTWFKKQLASNSEKCTVMLMHFPRYSSGKHGSQTSVAPLWRAAYAAKVDRPWRATITTTSGLSAAMVTTTQKLMASRRS